MIYKALLIASLVNDVRFISFNSTRSLVTSIPTQTLLCCPMLHKMNINSASAITIALGNWLYHCSCLHDYFYLSFSTIKIAFSIIRRLANQCVDCVVGKIYNCEFNVTSNFVLKSYRVCNPPKTTFQYCP